MKNKFIKILRIFTASKTRRRLLIIFLAFLIAGGGLMAALTQTQASPSTVVDASTSLAIAQISQRRIVRTTNGSNSQRVFAVIANGSDLVLYYADDPDASSPTWNTVTVRSGTTYNVADMVWDESNNVLYMCYAARSLSNNNNRDVKYVRISSLGSTPSVGAEQTALDGVAGAATYTLCNIEIAGDSGTTKVFVTGNGGTAGGSNDKIDLVVGTINSDTPTWSSPYTIKSWTASGPSGNYAFARMNTNKLVMLYYDGANISATRHDDSASATASSGWDALDGTDNSQTIISADDPVTNFPIGSATASFTSDIIWFTWQDDLDDFNSQSWQNGSLGVEEMFETNSSTSAGPTLTTDGVMVYMLYRNSGATSTIVYQSRPLNDGHSAWKGNEIILFTHATETTTFPNVAKKLYQGKLDLITISGTNDVVNHASSYLISGNAYQQSASSPYEGTTVWSGCDSATENVSVSIAGGTKYTTWCDTSTGAYNLVLPQPAASDSDITVFLDGDDFLDNHLTGYWKLDEASWNGTTDEIIDYSPALEHGEGNGNATTTSTAKFGRAGTFDGAGDYAGFGNDSEHDLVLPFSMSAWIYITELPSSKGSEATILAKYNAAPDRQYSLAINTSDTIYFLKSHDGTNTESMFSTGYTFDSGDLNTWFHIAVTADRSGVMRLYVNGSQADSGTLSNTTFYENAATSLRAASLSDGSNYFKGNIDDIRLYKNTYLTSTQISYLYSYDPSVGGGHKGAIFTHNNDTTTDITGMSIYKDRSIIRSESSSSITNADINTYDQTNDLDIPLASNGTNVTADSGTKILVNTGDTFAPGGNVTAPKLHIKGTYTGASETLTLFGTGSSSSCDDTLTNLRPLCIDSGTFTPSSNITLFSGNAAALIQNTTYNTLRIEPSANSISHTFMGGTTTVNDNITFGNGSNTSVTVTAAANNTTLDVNGNLTIAANTTFTAHGSNTMLVGGNWSNSGSFTHSSGTILFDAGDTGNTIVTGGTASNQTFNHVQFNNGSGGWTIQTNDMKVAGNLTLTNVNDWTLDSGRTLEVGGTYSIADAETAATTWTGSTLYLNSGTAYTVGTKNQSAETYATLQVGANTDIRTWNSSASTTTVDASGSLYSQDHANTDGDVYIWGDFHTAANDYWSYATDFEGTSLGGSSRQVDVRVDPAATITIDSGDTLAAIGTSGNRTTVSRQGGSNGYGITVASGGTINFQYTNFDYLDGTTGLDIQSGSTVIDLSNTKFDNLVSSDTDAFITVASSVIGTNNVTFTGVQFDNTGSGAECNVNRTGSDNTGYWDFDASSGTFDGEASDCKEGANEDDPGMLRWDDSTLGPPPDDIEFDFGNLNLNGITIN